MTTFPSLTSSWDLKNWVRNYTPDGIVKGPVLTDEEIFEHIFPGVAFERRQELKDLEIAQRAVKGLKTKKSKGEY